MKAKIIFSSGLVAVLALLGYYFLGGFNPIDFKVEADNLTIYGTLFEGLYDDPQLEENFLKARELAKENSQNRLVVVEYFLESKDSVKQFIGVVSSKPYELPSIELNEVTFIKGDLTSHPYVRPHPMKVRDLASDFAEESELKLGEFSLEFYGKEEDLTVWFPTKAF